MLLNTLRFFGVIFIFLMVFEYSQAEKRYCGRALTKKLVVVCESTNCSQIHKSHGDEYGSHTDEISTLCCRFGCTTRHMEQFCCLSNTDNEQEDETSIKTVEEEGKEVSYHKKKYIKLRDLKFKQLEHELEEWTGIKI
uniref:Insulin-like domain-containing protein n=1 Tax=Acrobeloides nanus TaxID=290746 RepID=A0A914D160_9BILA